MRFGAISELNSFLQLHHEDHWSVAFPLAVIRAKSPTLQTPLIDSTLNFDLELAPQP